MQKYIKEYHSLVGLASYGEDKIIAQVVDDFIDPEYHQTRSALRRNVNYIFPIFPALRWARPHQVPPLPPPCSRI